MSELKNCPFCGSDNLYVDSEDSEFYDDDTLYRVECGSCDASTGWCSNSDEAIEMWNQRADNE
ncbi:Lar family restriction alleviation protein [Arsenophonus nasoniae]|uniref:Lar family restriction alleviation protein n=1 Tax=Arsenophonus nasoniae TaxID=638 RepID=UPI00387A0DDD